MDEGVSGIGEVFGGGDGKGFILLVLVTVKAVVRVAVLIKSNLLSCMFSGGICDICSIFDGVVVVSLFPTTTIITNTTNITTTTTITFSFISTFTKLHTI